MNKIKRYTLSQSPGKPVYGLGLLTEEPDYRLCWLLNQCFSWTLVRRDDILVADKNSPVTQSYASYEGRNSANGIVRIISNRSKEGLWLTLFKQVDFLLIVSGQDDSEQMLDDLKKSLVSDIHQIRGVFKVPLPSFCYL
jgi:hypothetical protein